MNAPARIQSGQKSQVDKLYDLIRAAWAAISEAERENLFASHEGHALVNAMFELTECDDLYRLSQDINHELGIEE